MTRHRAPRSVRGFTLIELMIAVCIIGVLASVAMPAYSRYMIEARATEVPMNLSALYQGAVAYWNKPFSEQGIAASHAGRCTTIECCGGPMQTIPPLLPTSEMRSGAFESHAGMRDLGFSPAGGKTYASYAWAITDQGGNVAGCDLSESNFSVPYVYSFITVIDLNGDGKFAGSVLRVGIRNDDLFRVPGYITLNDFNGGACPICANGFVD